MGQISLIGGVNIGANFASSHIIVILGRITRQSRWGGGFFLLAQSDYYLPWRWIEEGEGQDRSL
jgi:hypothetical protein